MNHSFPILLNHNSGQYIARPLLFSEPNASHRVREKAIFALEKAIEKQINLLIDDQKMEEALRQLRSPQFRLFNRSIDIDQSGIYLRTRIAFVCWKEQGTEFLTAPFLEKFFFTVPKNECAEDYVSTALTVWIQRQKEEYDTEEIRDKLEKQKRTRLLETVTGTLALRDGLISENRGSSDPHAALLSEGRGELRQIGREHRFFSGTREEPIQPDKISQLEERLHALLTGPERKSAILLGGSFSGRTRMIETMLRRIDRNRNHHVVAGEWIQNAQPGPTVGWTLSPGAMIAGMSITGQWERRCHAIFEFAAYGDLILHFEPFLGFLEAGKTVHGGLSIADVIRSELVRERFRAVVELTPEELRLLREKDRLLSRRFEILEMPQLTHEEEFEIAVRTFQSFSSDLNTPMSPIFLAPFSQLTDYFESEKATPGRVCRWISPTFKKLRRNGATNPHPCENVEGRSYSEILSEKALREYQKKTGHDVSFFRVENTEPPDEQTDGNAEKAKEKRSPKERIMDELSEGLVGQQAAIEQLAETVLKIRTHLNDLSRPAGAFLFVGPTGVGKTEAAKQLAKVLYGSEEDGLVRFDANELTTSWSVAALLGSGRSEGTLVTAVRLRPNCVLLFDEIEKAHPDLADLLLQVLGEGRLTDGFGRVVSFAQCVIIFTSNLGVREAERFAGFDSAGRPETASYDRAIRDFFRPEWLNRLDGVIPFERLTRPALAVIVGRLIKSVKERDGFHKRNVFLDITPTAVRFLTDQIGDIRWGVRGVIRLLEKEFVTPAAAFLAETKPENVTILETDARDGKLVFHATALDRGKENRLLRQKFTPALKEELAEAVERFLRGNMNRYRDVFPLAGSQETQEELGRRFIYLTETERLIREIYEQTKEEKTDRGIHLRNRRKAQMISRGEGIRKPSYIRMDKPSYIRTNLVTKEWNDFLSSVYHKTADEIAAGNTDAVRRVAENFTLYPYFVHFVAFGPHEKKREGAVRIEKTLYAQNGHKRCLKDYLYYLQSWIAFRHFDEGGIGGNFYHYADRHGDLPTTFPLFPDWLPPPELKRGTTPSGLSWSSVVMDDAVFWMTSLCATDRDAHSLYLAKILRFDPETETPEMVVERWERDPDRTWGPMSPLFFPESRLPEPISEILRRHLGDGKQEEKRARKETDQ